MLISSPVAGCCATNSFIDNIVGNVVEIQQVLEDLIRWSDVALGVAKDQDVQRAAAVLRGAVLFPDHVRLQVVAVELKIGDPGTWAAARLWAASGELRRTQLEELQQESCPSVSLLHSTCRSVAVR